MGKYACLLGLVLILIASACTPSPAPAGTQSPPAIGTTPAEAGAVKGVPTSTPLGSTPKSGGTFTAAYTVDPAPWDPYQTAMNLLYSFIGESLLRNDPVTGAVTPWLAESWSFENPKALTLKIKKGVRFHNVAPVNGREMTSNDVVWTLQRVGRPGFPNRAQVGNIQNIEAVDDYTVRLTLKDVYADQLKALTGFPRPTMVVLPPEMEKSFGEDVFNDPKRSVGTGPFVFNDYTWDVGGSAKRNPQYWESGLPYLDSVRVRVIKDRSALVAALRTGQVDMANPPLGALRFREKDLLVRNNPEIKLYKQSHEAVIEMIMQLDKPPFNDVRLRKAVFLALDRDELVRVATGDSAHISGPISWKLFPGYAWSEEQLRQREGYRQPKDVDVQAAQQLMRKMGYGPDKHLVIDGDATAGAPWVNLDGMEAAIPQLKRVWLDVNLKMKDFAAYIADDRTGQFNFRVRGFAAPLTADDQLFTRFHSSGGRNYQKFNDPEVDRLLEEQRRTLDEAKRKELVLQAQDKIWQSYPQMWMYVVDFFVPVQPWMRNLEPTSYSYTGDAAKIWIAK